MPRYNAPSPQKGGIRPGLTGKESFSVAGGFMRRSVWRVRSIIGLSVVPVAVAALIPSAPALAQTSPTPAPSLADYSALSRVRIGSITALPLNSPPINGFIPQLVFGLTDEQDPDDIEFKAHISSTPGGLTLPVGSPSYYAVATYDTGAQSHILDYDTALIFNIPGANREGAYTADIIGASGTETADITDGLGIYMTGFANASVSGGTTLSVTPGSLREQWNTSVLRAYADAALPNVIGAPMAAQYQAVISNTQTRHLHVGAETFRSPQVSFQTLNTALPGGYFRLTL